MFEQSFTVSVPTDADGKFQSSQPVSSPLSLDVKITAVLQSPAGVTVHGSFALSEPEGGAAEPNQFSLTHGETVDLGKWKAIAGENANVAKAEGYTEPPAPNTEVTVLFVAAPSFF
jgi:hypothetical protein